MAVKELRPRLNPETCAVCGRRLLQGEEAHWYVAPDSSRRVVCELCVPRAERAQWIRERDAEEVVKLRPARARRAGFLKRVGQFFGTGEEDRFELDDAPRGGSEAGAQPARNRRRGRGRRREPSESPVVVNEPRSVRAVPTGPTARLAQGLELFNASQFPRTIAGLSRSLGDPQVAAVNGPDNNVDIYVGWDIVWYSYRVDLGDATEPVEQSGRGNDTAELADVVSEWNSFADDYGRLALRRPPVHDSDEDDPPPVYGDGA